MKLMQLPSLKELWPRVGLKWYINLYDAEYIFHNGGTK
jgi:hypothetical protein